MGRLLDAAVLLLYPLIVFAGLTYLGVRWTAIILLALTARRFIALLFTDRSTSRVATVQAALVIAIIGGAAASGSALALRFTPFAVSLTFLAMFALSLQTTPIIERFARLQRADLPPDHVKYCLELTKVWIAVLSVNSALLLFASLYGDATLWTVLVGPVSYGLLGTVFTLEYLFRKWRFQEFDERSHIDKALRPLLLKRETR